MRVMILIAFMLSLNVLLFLTQTSVDAIATDQGVNSPQLISNNNSQILNDYGQKNLSLNDSQYFSVLPSSDHAGVLETIGYYIFPFTIFLNWLLTAPAFIISLLMAVPNFLAALGLPVALSWAIGVIWHGTTLFLIIFSFLK